MFLLFIISLSIIFYFICMELETPPPEVVLSGQCSDCSTQVESGWLVCPQCQSVLRESCSGCGKAHDVWMNYCPWCRNLNEKIGV